ncbi:unnamed protein product, partial [Linum tenue]
GERSRTRNKERFLFLSVLIAISLSSGFSSSQAAVDRNSVSVLHQKKLFTHMKLESGLCSFFFYV